MIVQADLSGLRMACTGSERGRGRTSRSAALIHIVVDLEHHLCSLLAFPRYIGFSFVSTIYSVSANA